MTDMGDRVLLDAVVPFHQSPLVGLVEEAPNVWDAVLDGESEAGSSIRRLAQDINPRG